MQGIKDKVVVITGASSGLGEAAARRLVGRRSETRAGRKAPRPASGARQGVALGDDAVVQTDVSRYDEVKRLVDQAVKAHGRVDVMINNAGLMPQSLLESLKIDEWDRMIDVNIKGVLYGIAAALPVMKAQKSGHIINVSSVAGHKVRAGSTIYSATKSAVRVISEGLRQEVKPYNIRTTIISPGAVESELPDTITDPDIGARVAQFYKEMAIPADSFASVVEFAMSQPDDVDINEILFRPTRQEY